MILICQVLIFIFETWIRPSSEGLGELNLEIAGLSCKVAAFVGAGALCL